MRLDHAVQAAPTVFLAIGADGVVVRTAAGGFIIKTDSTAATVGTYVGSDIDSRMAGAAPGQKRQTLGIFSLLYIVCHGGVIWLGVGHNKGRISIGDVSRVEFLFILNGIIFLCH